MAFSLKAFYTIGRYKLTAAHSFFLLLKGAQLIKIRYHPELCLVA